MVTLQSPVSLTGGQNQETDTSDKLPESAKGKKTRKYLNLEISNISGIVIRIPKCTKVKKQQRNHFSK